MRATKTIKKVRSFYILHGTGYFTFKKPAEKYRLREIIRDLNTVLIPKKTNNEFE